MRTSSPSLLAAVLWLVLAPVCLADPSSATTTPLPSDPDCPPWLREVRAQREAWEAQRNSVQQEAASPTAATGPGSDPFQATPLDARATGKPPPASEPYARDWRDHRKDSEARREARRQAMEKQREERERMRDAYPPFGWDNPWYYRGY